MHRVFDPRLHSGLGGVLVLLVFAAGALPALSADWPDGRGTMLRIEAPTATAPEGDKPVRLRIRRDGTSGSLPVRIDLKGSAEYDRDYRLTGGDKPVAAGGIVMLRDGEASAELAIEALDDVLAEDDEQITLSLSAADGTLVDRAASRVVVTIPRNDFAVTTTADTGEGSLRQAILNALALDGPDTVTFDTTVGPFATKQTILLTEDLPDLAGELTIDGSIEGSLWVATGVTVSGGDRHRVFNVVPGARVTLRSLTVAAGRARSGGGVANAGTLIVSSVTFVRNTASRDGGGLANLGGEVTVLNSTFTENRAGRAGGGLADLSGTVTVTNCTLSGNTARTGGGLFSSGSLLVRNSILANSGEAADCAVRGTLQAASTHNIIEANDGCGEPISTDDPRLAPLGDYNGPVPTMPLGGGSLAINMGDNGSAVDENGNRLQWDQRGNGDPRFVAGFTDIGAFETQAWPLLQVDTVEDREILACSAVGTGDCSLRGAVMLANVSSQPVVITFDPGLFAQPRTLTLERPLPDLAKNMTIDAGNTGGVTVRAAGHFPAFNVLPGYEVKFSKVVQEEGGPAAGPSK